MILVQNSKTSLAHMEQQNGQHLTTMRMLFILLKFCMMHAKK